MSKKSIILFLEVYKISQCHTIGDYYLLRLSSDLCEYLVTFIKQD
jgi:hypothetical protein